MMAQISHLEKTIEMLDEEPVAEVPLAAGAGSLGVPTGASLAGAAVGRATISATLSEDVPPPGPRDPPWFLPAKLVFSDGAVHTVQEVLEAVAVFKISRKAVGVWLSRRLKKGVLVRRGAGRYQLNVGAGVGAEGEG